MDSTKRARRGKVSSVQRCWIGSLGCISGEQIYRLVRNLIPVWIEHAPLSIGLTVLTERIPPSSQPVKWLFIVRWKLCPDPSVISKFSEAQILPHLQIMQLERKHWNIPACKISHPWGMGWKYWYLLRRMKICGGDRSVLSHWVINISYWLSRNNNLLYKSSAKHELDVKQGRLPDGFRCVSQLEQNVPIRSTKDENYSIW